MYVSAQVQEQVERSSHSGVFHRGQAGGDVTRNSGGQSEDVLALQQLVGHKQRAEHYPRIMLPLQLMDDIELLQHMHHVHSSRTVSLQAYWHGTHIEHSTDEKRPSAPRGLNHAGAL